MAVQVAADDLFLHAVDKGAVCPYGTDVLDLIRVDRKSFQRFCIGFLAKLNYPSCFRQWDASGIDIPHQILD